MILAVDIGNTYTNLGCLDKDCRIDRIVQLPTDRAETKYGYAVKLSQTLELVGISTDDLEGAVISSVVPQLTAVMRDAIALFANVKTLVVGAGVKTGLHIKVDDPGTVAADLVATAVAAKEFYPLPCIVIDMGTATTLSVIDEDGRYIGGAILPGAATSLSALAEKASLLPMVEISAPKRAISANTVDCMRSGIVYGAAGAVDGLIDRINDELSKSAASIVATGGIASVIAPHLTHNVSYDETLLLKGLGIIWHKNER